MSYYTSGKASITPEQSMSDLQYIVAAYSVTWLVLGGYALYLTIRSRRAAAHPTAPAPELPDV